MNIIINKRLKKINYNEKFGFIILRYVNSEITNYYWIHCYNCIRNFYKNKIIIIDSNSDSKFLKTPDNLINCTIIDSEYPGVGEISCLYYFYKNHFFEKAVIIQDSIFIHDEINFENYHDVIFFWHVVTGEQGPDCLRDHYDEIVEFLNKLSKFQDNSKMMNDILDFRKTNDWEMCFGPSFVIDYNFLIELENEFSLFDLLKYSNEFCYAKYRQAFERFFGLLCYYKKKDLKNKNPSFFGNIFRYHIEFGYPFENYIRELYNGRFGEINNNNGLDLSYLNNNEYQFLKIIFNKEIPIIKVWTRRL
jgi:hypothetical protein